VLRSGTEYRTSEKLLVTSPKFLDSTLHKLMQLRVCSKQDCGFQSQCLRQTCALSLALFRSMSFRNETCACCMDHSLRASWLLKTDVREVQRGGVRGGSTVGVCTGQNFRIVSDLARGPFGPTFHPKWGPNYLQFSLTAVALIHVSFDV
jgi:hypothetical protein